MANDVQVTVQEEDTFSVSTGLYNPVYVNSISDIGDVDTMTEGKVNGSVLVYKSATNKWTSTTTLDAQNMEGGEF